MRGGASLRSWRGGLTLALALALALRRRALAIPRKWIGAEISEIGPTLCSHHTYPSPLGPAAGLPAPGETKTEAGLARE